MSHLRWHLRRCALLVPLFAPTVTHAVSFATASPSYQMGNVFTASGAVYGDVTTAFGEASPIVGASTAFAGVLSPFNAHYETTELVAFGRGGAITLRLGAPVPVIGGPQIGVFTSASFSDVDFPNGQVANPARTTVAEEYGAERSAVVEVAEIDGDFRSLGRILFTAPSNYYANITDPFQPTAPPNAVLADFGKPFTQPTSSFAGQNLAGVLAALDGSAGGTWIDVPLTIGLAQINYVRLSDPLWMLPDGSFAETRTSAFNPSYVKPADVFIDAVAAIPEPGAGAIAMVMLCTWSLRVRRS